MRELRPEDGPPAGDPAEHHRIALLIVFQADAVVDPGQRVAGLELGPGVRRAIEADDQRMGVAGRRDAPLAEPVVPAVGLRQAER